MTSTLRAGMRLKLLGRWGLYARETEASALPAGKPLAALSYLGCSDRFAASRSTLISLLWADQEPDAARHSFRQTLWYIKRKAGEHLIAADGDTLRLSDSIVVDRDEVLTASRAGDHARVVHLYEGPFIPAFAAPGGAGFEEWAALERRRMLEVFRHSAERTIADHVTRGRAGDAIALARRLRDQDMYNEGGWRLLIEVCLSAGDTLAARKEAEALLQLVDRDGNELEPATRAVVRATRVTNGVVASPADDSIRPSLVGREESFSALLAAWEAAKGARLTRIHITSRAGLGKTRLLRDVATRIRAVRGRVVSLGGSQGTRKINFALVGDLAAGLASLSGKRALSPEAAATLVDLNPTLSTFFERPGRTPGAVDLVRARALALRELMQAAAFEHAVAVLIDDMHWWDEASAATLRAAVEGLSEARLLIVTAGRPEARTQPFVAGDSVTHLELSPLTPAHVEELLLTVASLPAESWAAEFPREVWRSTRGSPLLALELLQHLEEQDLLRRVEGAWRSDNVEALSAELRQGDAMRARIASLDRGDFWILALLATAGTSIDFETLHVASTRPTEDVAARLAALEGRGLVVHEGVDWRLAHDVLADETLRASAPEVALKAAAQLGHALGTRGAMDEPRAWRAMQLLRASGDLSGRADVLRRFAAYRYALGDRRSVRAMASVLLGATASERELNDLARTAPLSWRLGLVSPTRRVVAAGAVVTALLMATASILRTSTGSPPDAILAVARVDSTGRVSYESVEVRDSAWSPLDPLRSTPWSGPSIQLRTPNGFNIAYSPVGSFAVSAQAVSDTGAVDLFIHRPYGPSRPLVPAQGDDVAPAVSPDGSSVAFSTARWNALSRYDIAVATLGDTVARPLTSGPSSDLWAQWSPDGRRVAFGRSHWGERPNEVCVADVGSASTADCIPLVAPFSEARPVGWLDGERLVVVELDDESRTLRVLHWPTRTYSTLYTGFIDDPVLSPDGRWIYCVCTVDPTGAREPAIVPVSAPNLVRPIRLPNDGTPIRGAFWVSTREVASASSLALEPSSVVHAGIPAQLRVRAFDGDGRRIAPAAELRWRLLDTLAGSIDSLTGLLVANGASSPVRVLARARSIVSDTLSVRVDTSDARLVLSEDWETLDGWQLFGSPTPTIGVDPKGRREFLNNGDGSFVSGAMSLADVNVERGVVVEAEVTTPITLPQWQQLALSLIPSEAVNAVGRSRVSLPPTQLAVSPCELGYPSEGRVKGLEQLVNLNVAGLLRRVKFEGLNRGETWTMHLQLFPDGRCGLAINGRAVAMVDGGKAVRGAVRVWLGNSSFGTRVAVGRIRVWEGVGVEVDWSRLNVPRPQ